MLIIRTELKGRKKEKKKDAAESSDEQKPDKEQSKGTDAESSVVESKDQGDKVGEYVSAVGWKLCGN